MRRNGTPSRRTRSVVKQDTAREPRGTRRYRPTVASRNSHHAGPFLWGGIASLHCAVVSSCMSLCLSAMSASVFPPPPPPLTSSFVFLCLSSSISFLPACMSELPYLCISHTREASAMQATRSINLRTSSNPSHHSLAPSPRERASTRCM